MSQVSDYDYDLPPELIAQEPLPERGASRMLVLSREKKSFKDELFANFHRYIRAGDCLVLNDTRVFPARLHGRRNKTSGASVEVFLLRALNEQETDWDVLVRPARRAQAGDRILFDEQAAGTILSEGRFGERTLRLELEGGEVRDWLERFGEIPLPPYIHRKPGDNDRERYQTVFAEKRGSVAAPTAGLHFTTGMLDSCRSAGAAIAYVTLHVGLGTFAAVRGRDLSEINLHEEYFEVSEENARVLSEAKRLICVGTTSVRTIETALLSGPLRALRGETNLFIYPGFDFRGAGAMVTNFHLPESSLLMLVSAFAGRELTLVAYNHAVAEKYRFFSYGDCMFIE